MNERFKLVLCLTLAATLLAGCGGPSYDGDDGSGSTATAEAGPTGQTLALKITGYGPKLIQAGVPFNRQPDGSAATWVRVDRAIAGSHAAIDFDGSILPSVVKGDLVTAPVPASLYAAPGAHTLHVAGTTRGGDPITSDKVIVTAK